MVYDRLPHLLGAQATAVHLDAERRLGEAFEFRAEPAEFPEEAATESEAPKGNAGPSAALRALGPSHLIELRLQPCEPPARDVG